MEDIKTNPIIELNNESKIKSENNSEIEEKNENNSEKKGIFKILYIIYFTIIIEGSCETFLEIFEKDIKINKWITFIFVIIYSLSSLFISLIGINNEMISPFLLLFVTIINLSTFIFFISKENYKLIFLMKKNLILSLGLILISSLLIYFLIKFFKNILYFFVTLFLFYKLYQSSGFKYIINGILGNNFIFKMIFFIIIFLIIIFIIKRYFIFYGLLIIYAAIGSISSLIGCSYFLYLITNGKFGFSLKKTTDFIENSNKLYIFIILFASIIIQYFMYGIIKIRNDNKKESTSKQEEDI